MAVELLDSYPESNYSTAFYVYSGWYTSFGQSFHNDTENTLYSCQFYVRKMGTPTGNVVAKLYACTGTLNYDSKPTGSALAVSDAVDISTLGTSFALQAFTFSGANQITLEENTNYVIQCEYAGGDGSNCLLVGYDSSSPTHDGNPSYYSSSWLAAADDVIFYINGDFAEEELTNQGNFLMLFYP